MKRIHIVGRRNHGKTTLVVELVEALCQQGYRVGTLKHSSHDHVLDEPGKDSYRHRMAGGNPAVIVTPETTGIFIKTPIPDRLYDSLSSLYAGCDLILVEGNIDAVGAKIEVWRAERGTPPLFMERDDIVAVVTEDQLPVQPKIPVLPRHSLQPLLSLILQRLDLVG